MLKVKQNDTARKVTATLLVNKEVINLTGAVVSIIFLNRATDMSPLVRSATILDPPTGGKVEYQLVPEDTATVGDFYVEFHVLMADNSELSIPNDGYYEMTITEVLS